MFHEGNRKLQDHFDSRRLADRLAERAEERSRRISDADREFIEARDMFFLATADGEGRPNCSYKGGDPGFVRVVDEHTVAFPNYDGNGMYLSMGNTLLNARVGLLFIDFEGQRRLRLNGVATISADDPLMKDHPQAQFVVRVRAEQVFSNCPRYIHKYQLVERSKYVPHAACETPVPDWKRSDWARDVLPQRDRVNPAGD
jgi:predicted pyridoxine 5'-phosphate oxidase superfamily flavin-nucleotide-binding protein